MNQWGKHISVALILLTGPSFALENETRKNEIQPSTTFDSDVGSPSPSPSPVVHRVGEQTDNSHSLEFSAISDNMDSLFQVAEAFDTQTGSKRSAFLSKSELNQSILANVKSDGKKEDIVEPDSSTAEMKLTKPNGNLPNPSSQTMNEPESLPLSEQADSTASEQPNIAERDEKSAAVKDSVVVSPKANEFNEPKLKVVEFPKAEKVSVDTVLRNQEKEKKVQEGKDLPKGQETKKENKITASDTLPGMPGDPKIYQSQFGQRKEELPPLSERDEAQRKKREQEEALEKKQNAQPQKEKNPETPEERDKRLGDLKSALSGEVTLPNYEKLADQILNHRADVLEAVKENPALLESAKGLIEKFASQDRNLNRKRAVEKFLQELEAQNFDAGTSSELPTPRLRPVHDE